MQINTTSFAKLLIPLSSLSGAKISNSVFIAGGQSSDNKPQQAYNEEISEHGQ
ncbi:MAG TPA: hypothetical protein VN040_04925 [Pseudosphingobacterium sp.]|nr:hypothetical protein [Pseudosphingobacterium sp.]